MEVRPVSHRPQYNRAEVPPAMRFQERDGEIIHAIQRYDGMLAKRQLKMMFWTEASQRAMEMRLSLLYHQGYLDWPTQEHWRAKPIPEPICWLGWQGIAWLAGQAGLVVEPPKTANESQLRRLENRLRGQGLRWVREPRWSQLAHDIAVSDVRLRFESAILQLANLSLETWVNEGEFLSRPDTIEFKDERGRLRKRQVRPDGYFALVDKVRLAQGLPARARFLVELDMATHDVGSFAREKVLAGAAYLQSPAYKTRVGDNSGRWLTITTGHTRLKNLVERTQTVLGQSANAFLFSTLEQVANQNPLTSPIWWQAGKDKPMALLMK